MQNHTQHANQMWLFSHSAFVSAERVVKLTRISLCSRNCSITFRMYSKLIASSSFVSAVLASDEADDANEAEGRLDVDSVGGGERADCGNGVEGAVEPLLCRFEEEEA